jgi:hypothetical protein
MGFDLRSRCQNAITHQESRISVDGSDATKTNFMQPELTGKYRCRLHGRMTSSMSSMTRLGWRLIVRGDAESVLIEGLF